MEEHIVKIKSIEKITHDVVQIVTEKPRHYTFIPGQATEVSINKQGWKNDTKPFTFTSVPSDDYLEFTIKIYPHHFGVTNQLLHLKENDELILHEVFGSIVYKREGVFIAGGAGITPFVSIFRDLKSKNEIGNNMLIFANKTNADIILKHEFKEMLGHNFLNILSEFRIDGYWYGHITEDFLITNIADFNQPFYLCGPPPMIDFVEMQLMNLEVNKKLIIKEVFNLAI